MSWGGGKARASLNSGPGGGMVCLPGGGAEIGRVFFGVVTREGGGVRVMNSQTPQQDPCGIRVSALPQPRFAGGRGHYIPGDVSCVDPPTCGFISLIPPPPPPLSPRGPEIKVPHAGPSPARGKSVGRGAGGGGPTRKQAVLSRPRSKAVP